MKIYFVVKGTIAPHWFRLRVKETYLRVFSDVTVRDCDLNLVWLATECLHLAKKKAYFELLPKDLHAIVSGKPWLTAAFDGTVTVQRRWLIFRRTVARFECDPFMTFGGLDSESFVLRDELEAIKRAAGGESPIDLIKKARGMK